MELIEPDVAWRSSHVLHAYQAFGLTVGCDFELPELTPSPCGPLDVRVVRGDLPRPIPTPAEGIVFDFSQDQMYFGWPAYSHFLLLPDNTILYEAAPGAEHALSFPLLGPVFSAVVHRAGRLLLHSSAVGRNERAVFFLGDKGAGKSTTAAALVGAGFDLVTDDILALETDAASGPVAIPGFPQLKLAPEAEPLLHDAPRIDLSSLNKDRVRLLQAFSPAPRKVAAGYVLVRAAEPGLRRLEPVAALGAVMRFSYITRFGRRLLGGDGLARHLQQCASLVNSIPVYELAVPDDLDRLTAIVTRAVSDALA